LTNQNQDALYSVCFSSVFTSARKRREEQSNKSGLNKTITERILEKKNKQLIIFFAIAVLILIIALYIGTFETPDIDSAVKTEYGVCLHLYQFNASTTIQLLKQLNATCIRIDWIPNQMDEFVETMKENNISILAILDHNTMNQSEFTRIQWRTMVQGIMSTEAAKKVDAWEIWNEPNAEQFYLGYMDGTPQNYFDLLKDASQIIRATSPNATIIAAGLSPNDTWMNWLIGFANLSPQRYFDFQGVHLYDDTETNLNVLSETKEIIGKNLWITEIGKPSGPKNQSFTSEDQAYFLKSNFQMLSDMEIPLFWYQLKDETNASDPKENYFGLFDAQDKPKPASEAFVNFTKPQLSFFIVGTFNVIYLVFYEVSFSNLQILIRRRIKNCCPLLCFVKLIP